MENSNYARSGKIVFGIMSMMPIISSFTVNPNPIPGIQMHRNNAKHPSEYSPIVVAMAENLWDAGDDWGKLSSFSLENSSIDASAMLNIDPATKAAAEMMVYESSDGISGDTDYPKEDGGVCVTSKEDQFISDTVDTIYTNAVDPNGPLLYDTKDTFDEYTKSVNFSDEMGKEISLLVRCNEVPDDLLVSEGRRLPQLKDEDMYHRNQLLVEETNKSKAKPTPFFENAVGQMFRTHASPSIKGDSPRLVLDSDGIASWMSQSLQEAVGKHDKRINIVKSKYSSHGTGVLTAPQFLELYIDAAAQSISVGDRKYHVRGRKPKVEQPTIMSVWRDLRNYGFHPPIVKERERMQQLIDEEYGAQKDVEMDALDECEILEWGDDAHGHSTPRATSTSQMEGAASDLKKSSHELVELCSDNKTPLRLRDGDFVFIDEESCIGCRQCANVSPDAFSMLDNGRARTRHQNNLPDVDTAVSVCPVGCMHNVSFDELKEMETARDVGGADLGRKHMGSSHAHIPLNVARIDSDANRRTSWYHMLKHKCFTSKSCPQRGCYDCPNFSQPGDNPYFKARHRKDEGIRAGDLMASGEAEEFRTYSDL